MHAQVRGLAEVHGLHPQVGFLHADRPGHAALASDLIEPVRPALDHAVLAAVRAGRFAATDFDVTSRGGVYLSADARPRFLALVERVVRTPRPWTDGPPVSLWARMAAETARVAAALRDGTPVEVAPFVGAARPAA